MDANSPTPSFGGGPACRYCSRRDIRKPPSCMTVASTPGWPCSTSPTGNRIWRGGCAKFLAPEPIVTVRADPPQIDFHRENKVMSSPEANTLAGKIALVTGAGRGLGRAFAEKLAAMSADVVIHGMRENGPAEYGEGTTLTA